MFRPGDQVPQDIRICSLQFFLSQGFQLQHREEAQTPAPLLLIHTSLSYTGAQHMPTDNSVHTWGPAQKVGLCDDPPPSSTSQPLLRDNVELVYLGHL